MLYEYIGKLVYKNKSVYGACFTNEETEDIISDCVLEYLRLAGDRKKQLPTLVHNNVVDRLRHRSVITFVELDAAPEPATSPTNMTDVIYDVSKYLDEDEIYIVRMRVAGFTYREISTKTKQNISRKMKVIKDKLAEYKELIEGEPNEELHE